MLTLGKLSETVFTVARWTHWTL